MPLHHRFEEVQAILKDASSAIGAKALSGIIAHITSELDLVDAELDLYSFVTYAEDELIPSKFRSIRSLDGQRIRFFMSNEESSLLIKTLTERLSLAYEKDRSRENLRKYYVANLGHKLGL